jgi:hypothetical protein
MGSVLTRPNGASPVVKKKVNNFLLTEHLPFWEKARNGRNEFSRGTP